MDAYEEVDQEAKGGRVHQAQGHLHAHAGWGSRASLTAAQTDQGSTISPFPHGPLAE